jgi:hypothetical protein
MSMRAYLAALLGLTFLVPAGSPAPAAPPRPDSPPPTAPPTPPPDAPHAKPPHAAEATRNTPTRRRNDAKRTSEAPAAAQNPDPAFN